MTPTLKSSKIDQKIESLGLKHLLRFDKSWQDEQIERYLELPCDDVLRHNTRRIIYKAVALASLIGAVTTLPGVWFQITQYTSYDTFSFYLYFSLLTILFVGIEIALLYHIAIESVHRLLSLAGYREDERFPDGFDTKKIMVRAVLEIEDPAIEYLGIDPERYTSRIWLIVRAFLYKAKVALTTFIVKTLLKKIATRYGVRSGFIWIETPVTAMWDGIVMYRVLREAKMRLYGRWLVYHVVYDLVHKYQITDCNRATQEAILRAISVMIVLSKNYHPNSYLLLLHLNHYFGIRELEDGDEISKLLLFLSSASQKEKQLISTVATVVAVLDGNLTRAKKNAIVEICKKDAIKQSMKAQTIYDALHQDSPHYALEQLREMLN